MFTQYFYTTTFTFMTLEALQFYSISSGVTLRGGLLSRKANIILGWTAPIIPTGLTAITSFDSYLATFRSVYNCIFKKFATV